MRALKLSILCLLLIAISLPITRQLLPGFLVSGQSLVSSLSAPVGVVASDNTYSTKVGISWDAVRGAVQYRIFRNTTNDPAVGSCVADTVGRFRFNPGPEGGSVSYSYPFVFAPSS